VARINNLNAVPGSAGVDEGFVIGEYLYGSWGEVVESASLFFPANEEFTALNLRFRIDPGAPAGSTEVRFLDGAESCSRSLSRCYPWNNEIISLQLELRPELVNSFLFVNGKVHIIGEVTTFIRGDSNGDLAVEMADAVFTLEHLFLGGPPPACPDAADANDDGLLDLSDPIAILAASFLGAGPLPPPAGAPGHDPTPDALGGCFPASR
jgi:hypothetical protein